MTINKNCISVVSINEKDHLPVRRQLRKAERCRCSADKGRNNQILRKHNQTLEVWRNTITQKSEETRSHNHYQNHTKHTITITNHTKHTITQREKQSKSDETQSHNHNQSLRKHNQTITKTIKVCGNTIRQSNLMKMQSNTANIVNTSRNVTWWSKRLTFEHSQTSATVALEAYGILDAMMIWLYNLHIHCWRLKNQDGEEIAD